MGKNKLGDAVTLKLPVILIIMVTLAFTKSIFYNFISLF